MRHPLRWLAPVIATFLLICGNPTLAQVPDPTPSLPAPAVLDALDTTQWSVTTLMVGQLVIAQSSRASIIPSVRRDRSNSVPSLARFVPAASVIGPQWQQVRSGNARAIIPALADLSTKVFSW